MTKTATAKKINISQVARDAGLTPAAVHARLHSGWTLEQALARPVGPRGRPRKIPSPSVVSSTPPSDMLSPVKFYRYLWAIGVGVVLIGVLIGVVQGV